MTLQGEVKRIFTGWVFAASPGLHAVEHPIYDVWLTDCKNPVVAAAPPLEVARAAPAPAQAAGHAHGAPRHRRPDTPRRDRSASRSSATLGAFTPSDLAAMPASACAPVDGLLDAERGEIAFADERRFQELVILPPRHLDRAEGLQVIGDELRVEQLEAAGPQPRDQMHERDLGRIARAVEHALAEEGAAERDAVEAAHQRCRRRRLRRCGNGGARKACGRACGCAH